MCALTHVAPQFRAAIQRTAAQLMNAREQGAPATGCIQTRNAGSILRERSMHALSANAGLAGDQGSGIALPKPGGNMKAQV